MEIAIIADDNKKELLVDLCIAYSGILTKHRIHSTAKTAKYISVHSGLLVSEILTTGALGGIEQLTSRISYNEIDILIFLRDPASAHEYSRTAEVEMLRMCDLHNIPMATNLSTAEVLIRALGQGDFDWREVENPRSTYNRRKVKIGRA